MISDEIIQKQHDISGLKIPSAWGIVGNVGNEYGYNTEDPGQLLRDHCRITDLTIHNQRFSKMSLLYHARQVSDFIRECWQKQPE